MQGAAPVAEALHTLQLRLGAVEAVLNQRPAISGRYSATVRNCLLPAMISPMAAALTANLQVLHQPYACI